MVKSHLLYDEKSEGGEGGDSNAPFDFFDDEEESGKGEASSESKDDGASADADKDKKDGDGNGEASAAAAGDDDQPVDSDSLLGDEDGSEGADAEVTFNEKQLARMAKELELEIDENASVKSIDDIKALYGKKLDSSRKQINVDNYTPEGRQLITMFEEGRPIEEFYTNKVIAESNAIIAMDAKEKVFEIKAINLEQQGLSAEEAEATAAKLVEAMSAEQLKQESDSIDQLAAQRRQAEVQRIADEHKQHVESVTAREAARIEKEKGDLVNHIKGIKEFMGIQLGEKTINQMVKAAETGDMQKLLNTSKAEAVTNAYLMLTLGKKLLEMNQQAMKEVGETNLTKGMQKILKLLASPGDRNTGSQSRSSGTDLSKQPFTFD